jgi:Carboxypeptidase regulatory-like domain
VKKVAARLIAVFAPSTLMLLLVLSLTASGVLEAQTGTGAIIGTITDASGAVVPNATVTITNQATAFMRTIASNGDGLYSAPALSAGTYQVRVEMQGFQTTVRDAQVLAGSDTTVNVSLAIGQSQQVITVQGSAAPQINYDTSTVAGSIERQSIQALPLNGRNFTQLATLEPGVTVSAGATSTRNSPISVSILGGTGGRTLLTLDGLKIMDEYDGTGTQINFSQEMVQEFQLASVGQPLSTGNGAVGSVNIVTRSGSNDFHGSAFFFYRDHNIAAYPALTRNPLNPNPYFVRKNPGGEVGGPLIKDKLFFFGSYEYQSQVQAATVEPGLPSMASLDGIFSSPLTSKWLNVRTDYRLNDKTSIFLRYTHDGNVSFGQNAGATPEPSNWLNNNNWSDQSAIGVTTTLNPNMVNDARFSYNYWRSRNPIASGSQCQSPCIGTGLPQTNVLDDGNVAFGNNENAPQNRIQRNLDLVETFSWQKGVHSLHFGAEVEDAYYNFNWSFCQPACLDVVPAEYLSGLVGGAANVAAYFPTLPSTITSTADLLNLPVYNITPSLYGGIGVGSPITPGAYHYNADRVNWRPRVYAQDQWKMRQNLTVNYGLAYEYESGLFNSDMPKPAYLAPIFGANHLGATPADKLDFAPSFGFAWSIGKSGKTVIRGGGGLYWDTQPIYDRSSENGDIGPLGNGRVNISAGAFTNTFSNIVEFANGKPVPVPIGASLPVLTVSNMTLAQFLQIYNQQIGAISQLVTPATPTTSGPYSVTNLDILKSAAGIYPSNFPLMRSYQTSIGVQRDLGHGMVLTADWARRQFENVLLGELDWNHYNEYINGVQSPVIPKCAASQLFKAGQECSTGADTVYTAGGRNIYEGLLVKLNKRFANNYQFVASYAYQNLNGETVVNLNNYMQGYGAALARNNLNVSGLVNLPLGFEIALNSSIISRTPVTATIPGVDLSGTGAVSSSPLPELGYGCLNAGCGKAQLATAVAAFNENYAGGKTPSGATIPQLILPPHYQLGSPTYSQDVRLTKTFNVVQDRYRLLLMSEFFNIFNIANLIDYSFTLNTLSANPATQAFTFGQPTQRAAQSFLSGGPRALQFGTRFEF